MKIKCPACDFENEEGAKFCSNCAEPLVTPETSINTENTNIKRIIKKERLRMNKKQRVILALFVPVLLFFVTLTIAYYVTGVDYIYFYYYVFSNWGKIWYLWILFLIVCCFFEYKLFEDKEIISNKKDKELK